MAVTRLSDAVIPAVYESYTALNSPELTSFYRAGLVERNEMMDRIARNGGKNSTLPFWNDLDANIEPNYSNDDPNDKAVPNKVTSGSMNARKAFMNQGFSSMDLIKELSGSEPMQHIRNRFGTYWQRQWQRRLIASVVGIMRDNVANNGSDMTVDITGQAGAAGIFNEYAVIDANGTMGDAGGSMRVIAVHSKVRDTMIKQDSIVYIPDSEGNLTIPTYKNLQVVVDDSMPIVAGAGATAAYLSVIFGRGAFGWGTENGSCFAEGEGIPKVATEVERDPRSGNGGGEETLWERKTMILHPQGYSWDDLEGEDDALVEFSPTLADLAKAAHWRRIVDRKNAPFAFVISRAAPAGALA